VNFVKDCVASPSSVSHKDVITAVIGASTALGGFALVFLGLLISAYGAYPSHGPEVRTRRGRIAWSVFVSFFLSVGALAASLAWFIVVADDWLYGAAITLLAAALAVMVVSAAAAVHRLRS
jgi:hypothetical protein